MKTRKQKKSETHFKLYMIRHGISCGNINYHLRDELSLSLYTDPELTQEGRAILTRVRKDMKKAIQGPFIVGASNLIRTQQSANLLFNPKRLYIVPAIGEFGRHNQENTPLRPSVQGDVLTAFTGDGAILKKRDYKFFIEDANMTDTNQVKVFLEWLGKYYKKLAKAAHVSKPNLVLVSHYGFINELICSIKCLEEGFIMNSALIEFDVTLTGETVRLDSVKQVFYTDDDLTINIDKNLKTDKCRIPLKNTRRTY